MSAWELSRGASDLWQTPAYIFDALNCTFDLDVAAPNDGPLHVPANGWLSSKALERDWHGFVWMNPPFGGRKDKAKWLNKFFDHGSGIALTPDRTSAPWFREAWQRAEAVMFLPKVKFVRPDGSIGKQPGTGTALWAAGTRAACLLGAAAPKLSAIVAMPATPSNPSERGEGEKS